MFEVIKDEQEALAGQVRHEDVAEGLLRSLSHAQLLGDRGSDQGRIGNGCERDEDHSIGKRRCDPLRNGERKAGLPGATWSG
jgi:hypothetical protein